MVSIAGRTRPDNTHTKPCPCWYGPVVLHDGGCCFDWPDPDGSVYSPDKPLPCGHEVTDA